MAFQHPSRATLLTLAIIMEKKNYRKHPLPLAAKYRTLCNTPLCHNCLDSNKNAGGSLGFSHVLQNSFTHP